MIRTVTLIILFLIPLVVNGQVLKYIVELKSEPVGELTVKRTQKGTKTEFVINSQIRVQKIINMNIDYSLTSLFENGKLIRSAAKQIQNGKIQTNSRTEWDGYVYRVNTLNSRRTLKDKLIDYNLSSLYYTEPAGKTKIWSDTYGEYLNIRHTGNHRYELTLPDGNKSYYTYNYGICSFVETEQWMTKISFRLTK